jgi:hypothetical protein
LQVLPVAVIFLTAQFLFTLSLANTSVTSNTILSSSASMWTLLTSALVLRERVTPVKLLSVVAVMAGAACNPATAGCLGRCCGCAGQRPWALVLWPDASIAILHAAAVSRDHARLQ